MSGRSGNFRRGGRGGRGSNKGGRSQNNQPNERSNKKKKKTIEDYFFYVGSSKQASDYEVTFEYCLNTIKKEFDRGNDIAEALRLLEYPDVKAWEPTLSVSESAEKAVANRENKQFEMKYKAELDEYMKRIKTLENNKYKAYAFLWERCAKAMQNKVMSRSGYETKIYNEPIELLKAIKEHALNYQETRYEMSIISDAFQAVFGMKQKENESLADYTRRFKTSREILESHIGGPIQLKKFVRAQPGYDVNKPEELTELYKKSSEQLFAYIYLENADQDKYGSVLKGLSSQKSLGNDQYPKTVVESNNVLSNHRFDNNKKKTNERNGNNKNRNNVNRNENKEAEEDTPPLTFAQIEGKCYCCGKPGHLSTDCYSKNKIPKEEWAINKTKGAQHLQSANNETTNNASNAASTNSTSTEQPRVGWAGVHCSFAHFNLRNLILLDSDSTDTVFCNKAYVSNIRNAGRTLSVETNGGPIVSSKKCDVPYLGEVWYNEASLTNIIALCDMAKLFRITMDSSKEKALLVHMDDRIIKFKQMNNGLYALDPGDPDSYEYKNAVSANNNSKRSTQFMNTVEDNLKFLSERQRERAKRVKELYLALGAPTMDDLKAMIRMNLIRNNKVTTDDVNLAMKVYGPDVGAIKGKATRSKPIPVTSNVIEIPDELLDIQKDVTLSIDGLTVNGLKFHTSISHDIYYRTAQYVKDTTATEYKHVMDELVNLYKRGGFTITCIHCDNEFRSVMDPYSAKQQPMITMNYAAAQEHVPRAERNNRTIKERVRAAYHSMPYNHLPRILVKYLVMESAKKLNFFPNKNGVSKVFSPRMILHRENLDYDKHCQYSIGEYVLAHDEPQPSNTNAPRALDCLYLRPLLSAQGGHELLHLQTNRVVKRRKLTRAPITPSIIKQVHALARMDKMPTGLKIANRTNLVLYDSALSAGVDYEDEDDDNDEDYDDNEEFEDNDDDDEDDEVYDEMDDNELADILQDQYRLSEQDDNNDEESVEQNDNEQIANDDESSENDDEDDGDNNEDNDEEIESTQGLRRSTRVRAPPERLHAGYSHLQANDDNTQEYDEDTAKLVPMLMMHFNNAMTGMDEEATYSFIQTYSLKQGLKKFKDEGKKAANKEMKQLHDRVVFEPINIEDMTTQERRRAMESLIFLTEKRDGTIKARFCANGSTQRSYISKEEAASPTVATESVITTGVIEAKQRRDVMTLDIPNAFVQTPIPTKGEKIVMKMRGPIVDIMIEMAPEIYKDYVVYEKGLKVLYVRMLKALYGMLVSSVLYYKMFRKDIESIGYEVNPYDVCVANKTIDGKQHTLTWHVDDVKASHVDSKVNDEFAKWCEEKYGGDAGKVKVTRGKRHDYLAMILDYSQDNALKVDMIYYIKAMAEEFPYKIKPSRLPWTDKLFKVNTNSPKLDEEKRSVFHTFVMKAMFLCKRGRPDVEPGVDFLAGRVKYANNGDWMKLLKILGFLVFTIDDVLTLEADDTQTLIWYVDASFAVHENMRSHTGAIFTLGKGAIISSSTKQKTNARSSTEAETNGIDDKIAKILWTKRFLEWQGFEVKVNIIYQDNTSTISLAKNGKASSGKRTRHFDIKLFYITDLIGRKEVSVEYCPTDEMLADYMSKPVVGSKFVLLRDRIMNLSNKHHRIGQQECVDR